MFKNRFVLSISVISLVLVTVALSKSFSGTATASHAAANDFYQRHPDWTQASGAQSAMIPVTGSLDLSDYALRHPELSSPAAAGVDTSDYYWRHPELTQASNSGADQTDYYSRHPGSRSIP